MQVLYKNKIKNKLSEYGDFSKKIAIFPRFLRQVLAHTEAEWMTYLVLENKPGSSVLYFLFNFLFSHPIFPEFLISSRIFKFSDKCQVF